MVIHPLVLHFPIALLLTGTVALAWSLLQPLKTPGWQLALENFISGALGLGYAGLLLSLITGLFDMQVSSKSLAREGWITIAILHLVGAVLLLLIYSGLLYRRFVILPPANEQPLPQADRLSLALAILGLIGLGLVGWLGGSLVYDYRVGIS